MKYLLLALLFSGCITVHVVDDRIDPQKIINTMHDHEIKLHALAEGESVIAKKVFEENKKKK